MAAGRLQLSAGDKASRFLHPLIDQVLPLVEVQRAHERLDTGHGAGKAVWRVAEADRGVRPDEWY